MKIESNLCGEWMLLWMDSQEEEIIDFSINTLNAWKALNLYEIRMPWIDSTFSSNAPKSLSDI